jgi:hypothetical protein
MFTIPNWQHRCASEDRHFVRVAVRARFRDAIVQAVSDKHMHLCNRLLLNVVAKLDCASGVIVCTVADAAGARSERAFGCKDALVLVIACCRQAFLAANPRSFSNVSTVVEALVCRVCPTSAGPADALACALRCPSLGSILGLLHKARGVKRASAEMEGHTTLAATERVIGDLYTRALMSYERHSTAAAKLDEPLPPVRPRLSRREALTPPLSSVASVSTEPAENQPVLAAVRKRTRVVFSPLVASHASETVDVSAATMPSAASMDDSTSVLPTAVGPPAFSSSSSDSSSASESDDFGEFAQIGAAASFFDANFDEEIHSDVEEEVEEDDDDEGMPVKRRKS